MKQVYLAGPITGLSHKGCTEWRVYAKELFSEHQIKADSPMRGKDYLSHLESISGTGEEYAALGVFATQKGIMTRDYFDCTNCDVLLVNLLGAKAVSIGTVFEMAWAYMKRTPIVVVMEKEGNPHEHMFVREAIGFRVDNLDDAIDVVKSILL